MAKRISELTAGTPAATDIIPYVDLSGAPTTKKTLVSDLGTGPHASDHENGGSDEISVAGLSGLLADAQTPLTHTHSEAQVTNLVGDLSTLTSAAASAASAASAAQSSADAHHTRHESGGADAIKLDDLSAPDDNTDLNVSTTKHGLTPKLPNDATKFLDGTGAYDTVKESDLVLTDITTNDVSTSKHGLVPKAPNDATKYLDGTGAYTVPAGSGAPSTADYVVETANGGLSAEVVVGTTLITTAADASKQAAAKAGRLFFPNNGVQMYRDAGASWAPWGPIFPLTPPVDGDFSWSNQGGASVETTKGGIYLEAPAGAGENMRIRYKNYPYTKFTLTVGLIPNILIINSSTIGIGFRASGTGKTIFLGMQSSGNVLPIIIQKHDTDTHADGTLLNNAVFPVGNMIFLQIEDDGTNRNYRWSMDGQHFVLLYTEARTTYITGDQIFFFANAIQASYAIGLNVIHWKEVQIP